MRVFSMHVKRWFDKVNGNSYFSARGALISGIDPDTDVAIVLPFQYGYGSHPEFVMAAKVKELGIIQSDEKSLSYLLRQNGIRYLYTEEHTTKKASKEFGKD